MRRFSISDASIYKRKNSPYYYAQLKNPDTGRYLQPKSTRETSFIAASVVVSRWLEEGLPETTGPAKPISQTMDLDTVLSTIKYGHLTTEDARKIITAMEEKGLIDGAIIADEGPDTQLLLPYLEKIWDFDESPYVRERLMYGYRIGRRHCYEQTSRLTHWREYFPENTRLRDVKREDLKELQFELSEKGKAGKTINSILSAGTVAFKWSVINKVMTTNPAAGLLQLSEKSKKRDILPPDQAAQLFNVEWHDKRAKAANMLAMTTGLRSGEVRALQVQDIGQDRLSIVHAWSRKDGLKTTKTDEPRTVPLLPAVRSELLELVDSSPYGKSGFIFYHIRQDEPCGGELFLDGLYRALSKVQLTDEEQEDSLKVKEKIEELEASSVDFHSWRHFYSKHMADTIEMRKVQLATGHKSKEMAEHYAAHQEEKDFTEVAAAVCDVFEDLLAG